MLRYVAVMHRSSSQNNDKFDNFLNNFDNFLNKISKSSPLCTVILGGFNRRSFSWWINDKITTEGTCFEALTSVMVFMITHILLNSTFCIYLIFTDQP